jgi:hypothetical protein
MRQLTGSINARNLLFERSFATDDSMFDRRYPWIAVAFLTVVATGVLIYYSAVVSGLYKDSLLARFRVYGKEQRHYPLCRFLGVLGWWSLMMASMVDALTVRTRDANASAPAVFLMTGLLALTGSLVARQKPALRESLPRWYFTLLRTADRNERRRIAFAWLRIPRRMRWRLNGDQKAFGTWTDTVRITVTYGARDPDDPWATWN